MSSRGHFVRAHVAVAAIATAAVLAVGLADTTHADTQHAGIQRAGTQQARTPAAAKPGSPSPVALPAPTGPHPVGRSTAHLVDPHRSDPWQPGGARELMVDVWYPATAPGPVAARPFPAGTARAFAPQAEAQFHLNPSTVDFAGIDAHATENPPAVTGRHPVLLYSPGAGDPRNWNSTEVTDLASRGYVVVTIDHPGDAAGVQFPDGHVRRSVLQNEFADAQREHRVPELLRKVVDVRVADTRFVLDRLHTLPHAEVMDTGRIGMFGHSGGGTTTAQAMDADRRIDAGIDLDGVLGDVQEDTDSGHPLPVTEHGLDRPFLLYGNPENTIRTSPLWREFYDNSTGPRRNVTLRGGMHASFTDAESVLGASGMDPATARLSIGAADPRRAVAEQRAVIAAFFGRWLRG